MKTCSFLTRAFLTIGAALTALRVSGAESVLAPPDSVFSEVSQAYRENGSLSLANISSALGSGLPLVRRGPVALRPHFEYRFTHGDGIAAGPGNMRETSIQYFAPGLLVELGKHWTLDYTPRWTYYSNDAFRDTLDQTAGVAVHYASGGWWLFGDANYDSSHVMLIETGWQTHQEKELTSLETGLQVGQHTRLEASVARNARYAKADRDAPQWASSNWREYSTTEWARYIVSTHLNVAAGVSLGRTDVRPGDDMRFVQPQAQIVWQPTSKIAVSAQGGIEHRRFVTGLRPTLRTPLYSTRLTYEPLETTKLFVTANRLISASYFENEITRGSSWSIGIEQRLLRHLFLETTYTGQSTTYLATHTTATVRADRFRGVSVRLGTVLFGRMEAALLYHVGHNTSDVDGYGFNTQQVGFELNHRF